MVPPSSPTPSRCRFSFGAVVAIAVLALAPATNAQGQEAAGPRVRAYDRKAAALLASGLAQSQEVAALVEQLNRGDLFVCIETGLAQALGLRAKCGTLRITAATPAGRYARLSIVVPGQQVDLIGALAHELQHAVEVAGAPEVQDAATLRRFYEAKGFRNPDGTYCTREAVAAGLAARQESARAVGHPMSLPAGRLPRSMPTR